MKFNDEFLFFFLFDLFSAASMYNTHETITVEPEREYDEKRQADDRKTKQKMDLIRSKLKTHPRKVKAFFKLHESHFYFLHLGYSPSTIFIKTS